MNNYYLSVCSLSVCLSVCLPEYPRTPDPSNLRLDVVNPLINLTAYNTPVYLFFLNINTYSQIAT